MKMHDADADGDMHGFSPRDDYIAMPPLRKMKLKMRASDA